MRVLAPLLLLLAACDGQKPADGAPADDTAACADRVWYRDADGDGWGDAASETTACSAPDGFVAEPGDCDDTASAVYPGAPEIWYDGADEDCSGGSDYDRDADGYDAAEAGGDDCDDEVAAVNPGATEDCATERDEDCDGGPNGATMTGCTDWYTDADGDGVAGEDSTVCACEGTAPYLWDEGSDCDDADPQTFPGAPELCDGEDNGCGGWSASDEARTASWEVGGAWTDLTPALGSGSAASPAGWTPPGDGTLHLCAGDWYLNVASPSGAASVEVQGGGGGGETRIDGGGGQVFRAVGSEVSLTLRQVTVTNGAANRGGGLYADRADVTLVDSRFEGNVATDQGGAVYVGSGSLTMTDTEFVDNTAVAYGGGVQAFESSVQVRGGTFTGNLLTGDGSWAYGGGLGVYVYATDLDVEIDGVTFDGDRIDAPYTTYSGGGSLFVYHLRAGVIRIADVTITGSEVSGDTFGSGGGAYLLAQGAGSSLQIEGLTVIDNVASAVDSASGGGVYLTTFQVDPVALTNVTATGNTATTVDDSGLGGGLAISGTTVDLELDTISLSGNSAGSGKYAYGGALWTYLSGATITATDLSATGNHATYGAGVYLDIADDSVVTLDNATLDENTSDGARAYTSHGSGTLALVDSVVRDNGGFGVSLAAPYGTSAYLELSGTTAATAGVIANTAGGVSSECLLGTGSCTVTATVADFGVSGSADDNGGLDVTFNGIGYDYDDDESFTCSGLVCR